MRVSMLGIFAAVTYAAILIWVATNRAHGLPLAIMDLANVWLFGWAAWHAFLGRGRQQRFWMAFLIFAAAWLLFDNAANPVARTFTKWLRIQVDPSLIPNDASFPEDMLWPGWGATYLALSSGLAVMFGIAGSAIVAVSSRRQSNQHE
jgi:hypothetical protein